MKHLKKVSLNKQVPDDVKVAIINDSEKRRLFHRNLQPKQSGSLLSRLWNTIEHWPDKQRRDAIKVIRALESSPSFGMNDNFELVYNGDVMGGTNILQLIKSRVRPPSSGRQLLPWGDLFDHILSTAPLEVPRPTPVKTLSPVKKLSKYGKVPRGKKIQNRFSSSPRRTRGQAIQENRWA